MKKTLLALGLGGLLAGAGCATAPKSMMLDEDRPPIIVWGGSVNFQLKGTLAKWPGKGKAVKPKQQDGVSVESYTVEVRESDPNAKGTGTGPIVCGALSGSEVTLTYARDEKPSYRFEFDRPARFLGLGKRDPRLTSPIELSVDPNNPSVLSTGPIPDGLGRGQVDVGSGSSSCEVDFTKHEIVIWPKGK